MSIFIYAKVSTDSQELDSQINSLKNFIKGKSLCVDEIVSEKVSTRKDQSELKRLLSTVKQGGQVFITELSRLARTVFSLVQIANDLKNKNVDLISLKENINIASSTAIFIYRLFVTFYELERNLIADQTKRSLVH
jgi:DNA invertase Pin-like site-specific DNA recombinase